MATPIKIVVLGAGYAGLLAAMRLAGKTKRLNVRINLVNASDVFVERLRLHQFAANQTLDHRSIPRLLAGTQIQFLQGTATRLDPVERKINVETTDGARTLAYDYLVYALGSMIERDRVPGVRAFAYTLTPNGELSAVALRETLPALNENGARLLVCGGGATGIEAAAEFAESYPRLKVMLVTRGEFGMFLGKEPARLMRASLERLGVTIQDRTTIAEVKREAAITASGEAIPFDACLWAGGFTAPTLAREAGLAVNERNQILIDPYMRALAYPEIYAVGDAATPVQEPSVRVRMSAFTAVILGAHGADSLSATLHHKPPRPLSFAYMGQGIALGRHDALGFGNAPDDTPHAPYFTGMVGYAIRESFVKLLAELPKLEKRVPGIFYWLGKKRFEQMNAGRGAIATKRSFSDRNV